MSDQQGSEAPASVFTEAEEAKQVVLPGALLAAQRQAKGWTVEHAAGHLKFATRQVLALEADNYAALPGPVTVRGFVRAYAKLLGMDPDALVAILPQDGPVHKLSIEPQRTLSTPFSESPLPLGNRNRAVPILSIAVIVVIIVAAAGTIAYRFDMLADVPHLTWFEHAGNHVLTPAESQVPAEVQQELSGEVQDGADKNGGRMEKGELLVGNAENSAPAAETENSVAPDSEPVKQAASVQVATSVPTPNPAPAAPLAIKATAAPNLVPTSVGSNLNISKSKDLLHLTFREDSWVEIRRGDKSTIISRLLKAGTTEAFDISEPVTLVVGNAAGVDANLRGLKLDLATSANSNVARLNLK